MTCNCHGEEDHIFDFVWKNYWRVDLNETNLFASKLKYLAQCPIDIPSSGKMLSDVSSIQPGYSLFITILPFVGKRDFYTKHSKYCTLLHDCGLNCALEKVVTTR